jgi:hypothetical protein
MPEKPTTQEP